MTRRELRLQYTVVFAELWGFHPRDIERLTIAEFNAFKNEADQRIKAANRQQKQR